MDSGQITNDSRQIIKAKRSQCVTTLFVQNAYALFVQNARNWFCQIDDDVFIRPFQHRVAFA